MDFTIFADRVKEARKKAGLNQAELAEKLGVGQNTVSNYENATGEKGSAPKLETAAKMAEILNVSLDWLVGNSDSQSNEVTVTGNDFLNYLIITLENPYSDCSLSKPSTEEKATGAGFSIRVSGTKAGKLYIKLENLLSIRQKLKDGDVPDETVNEVVANMRQKIVEEYGDVFNQCPDVIFASKRDDDEDFPF